MEQLLRDPLWQFVGVLIAVVALFAAIAVPLIVARRQRKQKNFEYRILTSTPIFNPAARDKFELLFEKQHVEGVQLVILRIVNTGNVEINPVDYHERVTIEFSSDSRILSAEVITTSPTDLTTSADVRANRVFFPPVLLNAGDWFTVKCLVASFKQGIKVSGRISGVKEIHEHVKPTNRLVSLLAFLGFPLMIGFGYLLSGRSDSAWVVVFAIIGWLLWMFAVAAYSTNKDIREQKLFG